MTKRGNLRPKRGAKSRYKGVYRNSADTRWVAHIHINGQNIYLGFYHTEEEAARAYDAAALHYRGPEAFQNMRDLQAQTEPIVEGDRSLVPLNDGGHIIIDTEDLEPVRKYYWNRVRTLVSGNPGKGKPVHLHILLLGKMPKGHTFVNINGNRLDYRKSNLAVIPLRLQAGRHRKIMPRASIYKGVSLHKKSGLWRTTIRKDDERRLLGYFERETDAALAYDQAARQQFGLFAALNFPRDGEVSCYADDTGKIAA
jgi:hypothetical protein